jgi:hypothetical protein
LSDDYIPIQKVVVPSFDRFKSLSLDDKHHMQELCTTLFEKQFPVQRVTNLLATLREEEGPMAYKMLERYATSITPVQMKSKGVYTPLDSFVETQMNRLTIYLPEHLEQYADHGLIQELLRYKTSIDNVEIKRCSGELKIPNETHLCVFIMGYVSELLSDQKMAKVSYSKASYYQQGRMVARAKIIQMVSNDLNIPMKYFQVPHRYLGGTNDFREPEQFRVLRSLIADEIDLVDELLKNLVSHTYHICGRDKMKAKVDESLLMPFAEFVHMHERRARNETKGKKGKINVSFETIKPTKPSVLATVAPWEQSAVSELYDKAWDDLHSLEKTFRRTPALDRNYNDFSQKLAIIIDSQWSDKQKVLHRTRQRLAMVPSNDKDPLWMKLNAVRVILSGYKILEAVEAADLPILSPFMLIPSGNYKDSDGYEISWSEAFKQGKLQGVYPNMSRLIETYCGLTSQISEGKSSG